MPSLPTLTWLVFFPRTILVMKLVESFHHLLVPRLSTHHVHHQFSFSPGIFLTGLVNLLAGPPLKCFKASKPDLQKQESQSLFSGLQGSPKPLLSGRGPALRGPGVWWHSFLVPGVVPTPEGPLGKDTTALSGCTCRCFISCREHLLQGAPHNSSPSFSRHPHREINNQGTWETEAEAAQDSRRTHVCAHTHPPRFLLQVFGRGMHREVHGKLGFPPPRPQLQ